MLRTSHVAVVCAIAALSATPALAAGPTQHFHDTSSSVLTDFCDGPYTVIATNDTTVNVWGTPSDTTNFKVTESRKLTLTNPENGASVLVRSAGLLRQVVTDTTNTASNRGIQLLLQTPGGPVLAKLDIGYIDDTLTFDANGNVISDTTILHGIHSGTDFCDVALPALGFS